MWRLDSPVLAKARQEALYAFLRSQEPDEWFTLRQIATELKDLYPEFILSNFHDSTCRRWITNDIAAINNDPDYEKVIISGALGIKLATREEFEGFLRSEYAETFKKLKYLRFLEKKAGLDGQLDIEGEVWRESFVEV